MQPLLSVQDLRVKLATRNGSLHAVRGISFDVQAGETFCIVGESGCGKSMTALALMDLLPRNTMRQASNLCFQGSDLMDPETMNRVRGRKMSMIFQDPMTALNPAYTIGNQMTEAHCHHTGASKKQATEKAVDLLERVGISSPGARLRQYPHQLSGGLRQRVMIAMALMQDPALLIADEPTTALDVTIQTEILHLLQKLQRDTGLALILITHDLGVVAHIATHVGVMYAGKIVEKGEARQVFAKAHHPYTQALMQCIPDPARINRAIPLGTIPGTVLSLLGPIPGCGFAGRCAYAEDRCKGDIPLAGNASHNWSCVRS